jgi:hypothetical protein
MIQDLFNKDRPVFVRFQDDRFTVGERRREQLHGVISDMIPMRKRFEGNHLVCSSPDGITGKHGQRCALCRERWSCAERLRLMMLLEGLEQLPIPAILEIGHGSFEALDLFLNEVGADSLQETSVAISIERREGRLRFTFHRAN